MTQHSKEVTSLGNIYRRPVSEIMSRDVVSLSAGDTIHEALALMGENRVSALPVVNRHNQCVGILSTSDLVDMTRDVDDDIYHLDMVDPTTKRFLLDRLAHSMGTESVQSFMSEAVTKATPDTTIGKALREMLQNRIHHLPIINEDDSLMGIVSTMDILAEFADAAPR
ncbi:CBS domain-containing protein [Rubripirellula reticaptiva]|uniref:Inosine 5'-monophosphate dehydrogenase n=1 Tax=Rubripirellula reticaptiva TaxID=2528013 RepID=A0A5C6F522_9BACT|nr:CBS domain-containing protein [Rubripirellula reticaptiva]TWU55604.1 inosine 5'-monophosphate dehydrogenase [Rubripirellula reticaptiva]